MSPSELKVWVEEIGYGKRLPSTTYVYWEKAARFGNPLDSVLEKLSNQHSIPPDFNVIKFRPDEGKLSFLLYPNFFTEAHPSLRRAVTVDLFSGKVRYTDYAENINPPILHRKEQLLPPSDPRKDQYAGLTESEEAEGLYSDTKTIGFKLNWERLLASKGLSIEGHELHRINSEWVESLPTVDGPVVQRHRTALRRYELSKPVKSLLEYGLLKPGMSFFDFGCGLGSDIAGLQALGYSASGWDPNYRPDGVKSPAQVVNLGYVLNVIEDPAERLEAICEAWGLTQEMLVISVLIQRTVDEESARLLNDGVLTRWNTFQKYFDQKELQQYIEDALETTALPLALGVFVVFRDPATQQDFMARRTRRSTRWGEGGLSFAVGSRPENRRRKRVVEYEQNPDLLEPFWQAVLERGRIPIPQEFSNFSELVEKLGSAKHAFRVVLDAHDELVFEQARKTRKNDLLVYLALANLRKPVPLKHLSPSLREDMISFFDNYKHGLRMGRELLFAAGDPGEIEVACENLQIGWQDDQALYLHPSLLETLPPILRIYCGCAEAYCGDLGQVDLIKLHKATGKLTFLVYDDIEHQSLPELKLRIKVNLKTGFVQVFDHSADHQVLCFKERFFGADHPRRQEWIEFGDKLRAAGISDREFIGPSRLDLDVLFYSRPMESEVET